MATEAHEMKYTLQQIAHSSGFEVECFRDLLMMIIEYTDHDMHPFRSSAEDSEVSEDEYVEHLFQNAISELLGNDQKYEAQRYQEANRLVVQYGRKLWDHIEAVNRIKDARKKASRKNCSKKALSDLDYALWRYEPDLIKEA